ncbi:PleD family two-component system response regulator [Arsenicitalea aurantiaca]|uniref:diguanylate cyclase n=1 Tax=Arsenicitalea aurantiaca TaxID=1783274 RepID=A0A433XFQ9_9HYPH|nr:PleD family two-component system response regulator [Arsenicitalea aurantiaca]RUT32941.1 PleD family two-component system response regulator [Arsenicitalea aurantiaca]
MTARVLIVDDIPTNVRLLEARLSAEYFETLSASSGPEALAICAATEIDIILLDVMMPGMDGFEVCRRLKADARFHHIPVLMITALDQISDRVRGLEAGADDFLSKPVDDVQLIARVRSLARLKALTDELRARALTGQEIAMDDLVPFGERASGGDGTILLVEPEPVHAERIRSALEPVHRVTVLSTPQDIVQALSETRYELVLVSMALGNFDPLRVCSQIRTFDQSRTLPIILIAQQSDRARVVRGLDIGVNDFITRPVERNELAARVRTQLRRHRYACQLRDSVTQTMALAVTDELTGLYNRRYFDRHLNIMLAKAREQRRHMAVMLIDMDFFKAINDSYGHDCGDAVLKEFAQRLRRNIRGIDLACRFGGEEFGVLMPNTDSRQAEAIAERIRIAIAERGFDVSASARPIPVTVSVGMALNECVSDTADLILKRADIALYRAKREGRNRVVFDAA